MDTHLTSLRQKLAALTNQFAFDLSELKSAIDSKEIQSENDRLELELLRKKITALNYLLLSPRSDTEIESILEEMNFGIKPSFKNSCHKVQARPAKRFNRFIEKAKRPS